MQNKNENAVRETPPPRHRFGCFHLSLAVLIAVVLTAGASFFMFRAVLYPKPFKPVQLSQKEEQVLQGKLDRIDFEVMPEAKAAAETERNAAGNVQPEAYSEKGADRTIRFTERELNALLAKNTDLANKLAIALSPDLVSAKLLIPLDEDFPVLGGKTLRVKTGVLFRYVDGKPQIMLRGVMVMGVPLPNAWLGGLKNIDVVREFGGDKGFWKAFADGVESLRVEDGLVALKLRE